MADLIDRQAAIDFIDAGRLCNPNEPRWSDNEIVNFLKSRPSAQPERKTGRWKLGEFDRIGGYWATCSVCERTSFGGGKYCKYCGALMEGVDAENE